MAAETKSRKMQTMLKVLLILAILIVVNIISIRLFGRIDLTKNEIYTLSETSKELVDNLEDRLTIKAYFTEDMPAQFSNYRRFVVDILNEYRAYSDGKLYFEFISPQGEEGMKEAEQNGVPAVDVRVIEEDEVVTKKAFLGLYFIYQDENEVIPIVQDLETLEYDISGVIKRLTQKEKITVGYDMGHAEMPLERLTIIKANLEKLYDVMPVDLSAKDQLDENIDILIVANPVLPFSDTAKYNLDQFIMRGGRLAYLDGMVKIDPTMQNPVGQLSEVGLEEIMKNYGIGINRDLIKDAQCATIALMRQQGEYSIQTPVRFPFIPQISNFSQDNAITRGLQNVIIQFVSSVDTGLAKDKEINAEVIATSSEASGRQTSRIVVDPTQEFTPDDFAEEYIPIAAVFTGKFKSFFRDKEPKAKITESPDSKIVVVGSGQFLLDNIVSGGGDNLTFFLNIIDYLTDESGLISVRSKNVSIPELDKMDDGTKKMLKYGNMIAPPLIVILFGLFRWRKRVTRKRLFEEQL